MIIPAARLSNDIKPESDYFLGGSLFPVAIVHHSIDIKNQSGLLYIYDHRKGPQPILKLYKALQNQSHLH